LVAIPYKRVKSFWLNILEYITDEIESRNPL